MPMDPLFIDPGELRHKITITRVGSGQDDFGQPVNTWTPFFSTRAKIQNLSGQQLYQAAEFTSAAQVRIMIRWPGAAREVRPGDRVLFGSHVYVVQIVDNVLLRNRKVNLNCVEINGAS